MIEFYNQKVEWLDTNQYENDFLELLSKILATPYQKGVYDLPKTEKVVALCVKRGHLSVLEHCNVTLDIMTNIATYKDYTRHRHCAFTIESTSFVRYDKFPVILTAEADQEDIQVLHKLHKVYKSINDTKRARDFLPQCCAARMLMTTNIREWRNIIAVRGDPNDNPLTNQLRDMIWVKLNRYYPFFFPINETNSLDNPLSIYNSWGDKSLAEVTGK